MTYTIDDMPDVENGSSLLLTDSNGETYNVTVQSINNLESSKSYTLLFNSDETDGEYTHKMVADQKKVVVVSNEYTYIKNIEVQ